MTRISLAIAAAAAALAATTIPSAARADPGVDPLRFWEGRTESVSIVRLVMKKPYKTRAIGRGKIRADGSLDLLQRIEEDGREVPDRRWHIRKIGPGRFTGTMSEAKGPVSIDEIAGRYRFRFKIKGGLSVEQWLTPLPGGRMAQNKVTIRKMGMRVGRSEGTVRKLD